jgi:hypothetical protein
VRATVVDDTPRPFRLWDDDALMCVAHHHAVHEGGWTMRLRDGATGHELACWEFEPPPLGRRRLRP